MVRGYRGLGAAESVLWIILLNECMGNESIDNSQDLPLV